MSINHAILQGRMTRDPELRMTNNGKPVCGFTVAWSERSKDTEQKVFLNCVAWDKNAEFIAKHFQKGQELIAEGRLIARKFTDKEGRDREVVEMVVGRVHFCGKKEDQHGSQGHGGYSGGFQPAMSADDEDLPF